MSLDHGYLSSIGMQPVTATAAILTGAEEKSAEWVDRRKVSTRRRIFRNRIVELLFELFKLVLSTSIVIDQFYQLLVFLLF